MGFFLFLTGLEHCVNLAWVLRSRTELSQFFYSHETAAIWRQTRRLILICLRMYDRKLNGCRQRLLFARQLTQRKCSLFSQGNPEHDINCGKFERAVGKRISSNIRKEILQEMDTLKASLLDLKKVRRNLKAPKFYFKETWHCDIDDLGLKTTQRRRFLISIV